jgi:ADP-dependent NAD(P)H-hydrate dehydratase
MSKAIQRVRRVPRLAKRGREGHKGDYGRVLVVGGSRGMSGAVAMASQSALRGGAGLVTFAAPATVQLAIATMCPCATSVALSCDAEGTPDGGAVRQALEAALACDVLAVGPGLATGPGQQNLVRAILEQERPLVLDADGLNNLARIDGWAGLRRCPMVLTPHPGEFSRLTGRKVAAIQASRIPSAVAAAREWLAGGPGEAAAGTGGVPLVLVLKGAGTVVTDGRRIYVNTTGNPGMATGGSGDVLTGVIAALLGQRLPAFEAAQLGVFIHGVAGDIARDHHGETGLIAGDIVDALPDAYVHTMPDVEPVYPLE